MFVKKSISRMFSVVFVVVFILALVGPAHAAPAVCPPSIGFGEVIECSIVSSGEADPYTFTASAGDKVLVRMSRASGNMWPGVRVYDPDGTKLCEQRSSDSQTAEIASCSLPSTGTYTVEAFDGLYGVFTGGYYLYLQRLNNPSSSTPINFGQTLPGSILTPAEMDTYSFTASAGDKVLVRMSKTSQWNLWPGARIYGPDGAKLCEQNSSDSAKTEIASCLLPSTGTYTILVYDSQYGTGIADYYLYLQRLNNPGSPVPITFGQTLSGSILTPAEMDTYTFTASAGDKILVRMNKPSGSLWPGVRVYDSVGTKLCEQNSSDSQKAEITSCLLPGAGTYTILAYDGFYGTGTAEYSLYLQLLNNTGLGIFDDVPPTYWASSFIERLYNAGITGGCSTSPLMYCPESTVTRAQMAIFILRGIHGKDYAPPAATGTAFTDVPANYWAAAWIEQLAVEEITGGCNGTSYCPDANITRAQMAIFLLRGKHTSAYTPPPATGMVFTDVPAGYWAAAWIEALASEGITSGCGGGMYCPDANVTRAQMAVFLVKTFNLP